jgi:integrase
VDSYIESRLAEKVAPSTINRELQLLAQSYRLAIQRNHLSTMPTVRRLSETGRERKGFFEMAEFEAVIQKLPGHLQDLTRFAFFTGWRKGEITSLRWADVDGQVIRLRPENAKNKHGRQVPLEGELRAILERRWAARQYAGPDGTASFSAYVFHRRGVQIGDIKKSWKKACEAAGVPGKHFHDFRRTAVRNMVRAGVHERVAMEISGHRTRSVFDRYNIVSGDDLRAAIQRTQDHLNGGRPNVLILPVAIPQSLRGVNR